MDPIAEQLHLERRERIRTTPNPRIAITHAASSLALALVCGALLIIAPPSAPDLTLAVLALALYAPFWQVEFEIGPTATTPMQLLLVPMWFIFDPALLPLAVATGQLLGAPLSMALARRAPDWRQLLVAPSDAWFAVGPAAVFVAFGPPTASGSPWLLCAGALVAQFVVDGIANVVRARAVGGSLPGWGVWAWMCTFDAALAPIGLAVALTMAETSAAILAIVPLTILFHRFAQERDQRIQSAVELSSAYRGTAHLMGDVLEADDAYTGGEHTQGVVGLALGIGQAMRLDARQMRDLEFGALLHDIGKLRVPNEIINKPGKLTDEEWAIIKRHPGYGQEMLDRVGGELSRAGVIVRAHHERWDGAGYPDGLAGEQIPIEARIITICDSFSAMTTDRSYRKGMPVADALEELARCAGSQFDPALVEVASALLATPGTVFPRPTLLDPVTATEPTVSGPPPSSTPRPASREAA